ncbi:hypothetical protein Hypma_000197 [Hypsizygus marmoreus]|uniref:Uncharacterized protein n=1 Tax=Hypsizygus marmoreus TaxID=39966 RepID=A0A369JFG5_HYPMA|nr:hypothetical protein Hypma_000197 [Hypsizygus marmoreus]
MDHNVEKRHALVPLSPSLQTECLFEPSVPCGSKLDSGLPDNSKRNRDHQRRRLQKKRHRRDYIPLLGKE